MCSHQAAQTKVALIHVWQAHQNVAATHSADLVEQEVETIDVFQHIRTQDQVKLSVLEGKIFLKINNCIRLASEIDTEVLAVQGKASQEENASSHPTSRILPRKTESFLKVSERPLLPSGDFLYFGRTTAAKTSLCTLIARGWGSQLRSSLVERA